MQEKDYLKLVLDEKLANKEQIRNQVFKRLENQKGVVPMKRKLATVALSLCLVAAMTYGVYAAADTIEYKRAENFLGEIGVEAQDYSRTQAKAAYHDMANQDFQLDITKEILTKRANELGIEYAPAEGEHVYWALKSYSSLTSTNRVTLAQVQELEAGLSYREIIDRLGVTKDMGKDSYILQYLVDGKMLLTLTFSNEDEICPMSGEELLGTLRKVATENNSELTFDAVVIQTSENSIFVDCPAYDTFDSASVSITKDTEIVFANGQKATIGDISKGASVIVTYSGEIRLSYPVQITAAKIVISE